MSWQRVVLGIGNPGAEYADTRHNAGFMVLDLLAQQLGLSFSRLQRRDDQGVKRFSGKVKAQVAYGVSKSGEHFCLVKPLTYVNLSGDVAGPFLRTAGLEPESLFVIVDDLNLPLGRIRVRPSGSSGGHNGLRSIAQVLTSDDYPRLRLGIGASPSVSDAQHAAVVDHVLAPFSPEEREVLGPSLLRAAEATHQWLEGDPVANLMDRYNRDSGRREEL